MTNKKEKLISGFCFMHSTKDMNLFECTSANIDFVVIKLHTYSEKTG